MSVFLEHPVVWVTGYDERPLFRSSDLYHNRPVLPVGKLSGLVVDLGGELPGGGQHQRQWSLPPLASIFAALAGSLGALLQLKWTCIKIVDQ